MHRFNMGNDNPIRNSKLLREAYEAGRRQALNEQMGGGMGGMGRGMGGLQDYMDTSNRFPDELFSGMNPTTTGKGMGGKGAISAEPSAWTTTWPWGNDPYPPNGWQGPDGWQWQRRPGSKGNSGWQRRRFDPFPPPGQWSDWQPPSGTGWSPTSWPKYQ